MQGRPDIFWWRLFQRALLGSACALMLQPVWAGDALVSVSHPLAAEAGALALSQGGDAVDAAAAIQFALNVVEPQSSGIGGGAFFLVYRAATHEVYALDAREVAPAADRADQFGAMNFDQASTRGIAVGVPGTLAGVEALRQRWGKLSLAAALAPAQHYARDGFLITPYLAHALQSPRLEHDPAARALTHGADGKPLQVGQRWRQPALAHAFELIAREGVTAFYRGAIAKAVVAAQQDRQVDAAGAGRMTRDDLAQYQVAWRTPLEYPYRGYRLVTMPPPSSGGVAMFQVLGMLERFHPGQTPGLDLGDPEEVRLTIDAMRLALADRARWMGDAPAGVTIPVTQLLSPAYLKQRSQRLNRHQRLAQATAVDTPEGLHTTHFSVVDHEGNVVCVTTTVEALWGTGILVPEYGFFLNNEMTDFNLRPRASASDPGINDVRPGHRPRSSMMPTLLFHGDRWVGAYGSPGGVSIISTVLEMTQDMLDGGLSAGHAIRRPRFAVMDAEGHTLVEDALPPFLVQTLRQQGDLVEPSPIPLGSVQWVGVDEATGRREGAADPRREGTVLRIPEH